MGTIRVILGGGLYHIETSPLICSANQWTGFYITDTSVMKDLKVRQTKTSGCSYITLPLLQIC